MKAVVVVVVMVVLEVGVEEEVAVLAAPGGVGAVVVVRAARWGVQQGHVTPATHLGVLGEDEGQGQIDICLYIYIGQRSRSDMLFKVSEIYI